MCSREVNVGALFPSSGSRVKRCKGKGKEKGEGWREGGEEGSSRRELQLIGIQYIVEATTVSRGGIRGCWVVGGSMEFYGQIEVAMAFFWSGGLGRATIHEYVR